MSEVNVAPVGRGFGWLLDGFSYFSKDAGTWIGITIVLFLIAVASNIVPLGGIALQIAYPVFAAGLMLGCVEQDGGRQLQLKHLFAGFSADDRIGQLVLVGVLYLVGIVVLVLFCFVLAFFLFGGLEFFQRAAEGNPPEDLAVLINLLLVMLVSLALYLPLLMAIWFAPVLVILRRMDATDAMKASFDGCLKNMVPFLAYGLLGLLLTVLATIPLMLGWLILFPMIVASVYIAYKEIFPAPPADASGQAPGPT